MQLCSKPWICARQKQPYRALSTASDRKRSEYAKWIDAPFVAEQHWASNQLCKLHLIVCLQMLCPTVLLKFMHLDWYVDCYLLLTRKQTCNHHGVRFSTIHMNVDYTRASRRQSLTVQNQTVNEVGCIGCIGQASADNDSARHTIHSAAGQEMKVCASAIVMGA